MSELESRLDILEAHIEELTAGQAELAARFSETIARLRQNKWRPIFFFSIALVFGIMFGVFIGKLV